MAIGTPPVKFLADDKEMSEAQFYQHLPRPTVPTKLARRGRAGYRPTSPSTAATDRVALK
jgi:hypothetical protein